MKNCSLFILLAIFLSACAVQKRPAPIEYHHKNSRLGTTIISEGTIEPEIVPYLNNDDYVIPDARPSKHNYKIIYHEVQVGETIEEIASNYKQSISDIASINDLYPPYYLDEFQIIKIKIAEKIDGTRISANQKNVTSLDEPKTPEFVSPLKGPVITKFGEKTKYGVNKGVNISAKPGTKVLASAGGKVIYSDYDATFGYLVIIKVDGKNIVTSYAHLEDLVVTKGSDVKQGAVVGYVGSSGKVSKPQLHFGVREGKIAKDPLGYISN